MKQTRPNTQVDIKALTATTTASIQTTMSTRSSAFPPRPTHIRTRSGYCHQLGVHDEELWHDNVQYIKIAQERDFWASDDRAGGSEITGNYDLYLADTELPYRCWAGTWNRWRREITQPKPDHIRTILLRAAALECENKSLRSTVEQLRSKVAAARREGGRVLGLPHVRTRSIMSDKDFSAWLLMSEKELKAWVNSEEATFAAEKERKHAQFLVATEAAAAAAEPALQAAVAEGLRRMEEKERKYAQFLVNAAGAPAAAAAEGLRRMEEKERKLVAEEKERKYTQFLANVAAAARPPPPMALAFAGYNAVAQCRTRLKAEHKESNENDQDVERKENNEGTNDNESDRDTDDEPSYDFDPHCGHWGCDHCLRDGETPDWSPCETDDEEEDDDEPEWEEQWSVEHGKFRYYNTRTQEMQWDKPDAPFSPEYGSDPYITGEL